MLLPLPGLSTELRAPLKRLKAIALRRKHSKTLRLVLREIRLENSLFRRIFGENLVQISSCGEDFWRKS